MAPMTPAFTPEPPARCEAGVAAIEFAIFAPMIFLGMLAMVDIGRAITARMEMDRNVRAGAQAAMSLNNDLDAIEGIILASTEDPDELTVDVAMAVPLRRGVGGLRDAVPGCDRAGGLRGDQRAATIRGDPPARADARLADPRPDPVMTR